MLMKCVWFSRFSFNSRTREGATVLIVFLKSVLGFNSRTREGATDSAYQRQVADLVSIHAPVRVRLHKLSTTEITKVSIHAPVRVRLCFLALFLL